MPRRCGQRGRDVVARDPRGRRRRPRPLTSLRRPAAGRPGPDAGTPVSSTRSLDESGSPSAPLATTTARLPAATAASLRADGNPAPPRPVKPASAEQLGERTGAAGPGKGPVQTVVSRRSGAGRCAVGQQPAAPRRSGGGWPWHSSGPSQCTARRRVSGRRTLLCSAKCGASRQLTAATTVRARDRGDQPQPQRSRCRFQCPVRGRKRPASRRRRASARRATRARACGCAADRSRRVRRSAAAPRVPSPCQNGRYEPTNGTSRSLTLTFAYLSSISVVTCSAISHDRQQARVAVHQRDGEARQTERGPSGSARDAQRDDDRQQHQRDHAAAARGVPERGGCHRGPLPRVGAGKAGEIDDGGRVTGRDQPGRLTLLVQPARCGELRASAPPCSARSPARSLRLRRSRCARPTGAGRQLRGSRMWCSCVTARPASAGPACCWSRSRRREAARPRPTDRRAGPARGRASRLRGRACRSDVTAEGHQAPRHRARQAIWAAIRSAVKALPVAPRSRRTPTRHGQLPRDRVEPGASSGRAARARRIWARPAGRRAMSAQSRS